MKSLYSYSYASKRVGSSDFKCDLLNETRAQQLLFVIYPFSAKERSSTAQELPDPTLAEKIWRCIHDGDAKAQGAKARSQDVRFPSHTMQSSSDHDDAGGGSAFPLHSSTAASAAALRSNPFQAWRGIGPSNGNLSACSDARFMLPEKGFPIYADHRFN